MNWITLLGLLAAIGTTGCHVPQVIQIIKTKHTKDISLGMYIILTSAIFLWLVYGVLIKNLPLIMANLVSFLLASTVLVFKIKYK